MSNSYDDVVNDELVDRILTSWRRRQCLPVDIINTLENMSSALISPLKSCIARKLLESPSNSLGEFQSLLFAEISRIIMHEPLREQAHSSTDIEIIDLEEYDPMANHEDFGGAQATNLDLKASSNDGKVSNGSTNNPGRSNSRDRQRRDERSNDHRSGNQHHRSRSRDKIRRSRSREGTSFIFRDDRARSPLVQHQRKRSLSRDRQSQAVHGRDIHRRSRSRDRRRLSPARDQRRMSPGRRVSPLRDQRRPSPGRDHRRLSPIRDQRRQSPGRDHRRLSPTRDQRRQSPGRDHRRLSPIRDQRRQSLGRRLSPVRDHRRVSPLRDQRRQSPGRDLRRLSPLRDHRRQSPGRRLSPIRDQRRQSPSKDHRRLSPVRGDQRRRSPSKERHRLPQSSHNRDRHRKSTSRERSNQSKTRRSRSRDRSRHSRNKESITEQKKKDDLVMISKRLLSDISLDLEKLEKQKIKDLNPSFLYSIGKLPPWCSKFLCSRHRQFLKAIDSSQKKRQSYPEMKALIISDRDIESVHGDLLKLKIDLDSFLKYGNIDVCKFIPADSEEPAVTGNLMQLPADGIKKIESYLVELSASLEKFETIDRPLHSRLLQRIAKMPPYMTDFLYSRHRKLFPKVKQTVTRVSYNALKKTLHHNLKKSDTPIIGIVANVRRDLSFYVHDNLLEYKKHGNAQYKEFTNKKQNAGKDFIAETTQESDSGDTAKEDRSVFGTGSKLDRDDRVNARTDRDGGTHAHNEQSHLPGAQMSGKRPFEADSPDTLQRFIKMVKDKGRDMKEKVDMDYRHQGPLSSVGGGSAQDYFEDAVQSIYQKLNATTPVDHLVKTGPPPLVSYESDEEIDQSSSRGVAPPEIAPEGDTTKALFTQLSSIISKDKSKGTMFYEYLMKLKQPKGEANQADMDQHPQHSTNTTSYRNPSISTEEGRPPFHGLPPHGLPPHDSDDQFRILPSERNAFSREHSPIKITIHNVQENRNPENEPELRTIRHSPDDIGSDYDPYADTGKRRYSPPTDYRGRSRYDDVDMGSVKRRTPPEYWGDDKESSSSAFLSREQPVRPPVKDSIRDDYSGDSWPLGEQRDEDVHKYVKADREPEMEDRYWSEKPNDPKEEDYILPPVKKPNIDYKLSDDSKSTGSSSPTSQRAKANELLQKMLASSKTKSKKEISDKNSCFASTRDMISSILNPKDDSPEQPRPAGGFRIVDDADKVEPLQKPEADDYWNVHRPPSDGADDDFTICDSGGSRVSSMTSQMRPHVIQDSPERDRGPAVQQPSGISPRIKLDGYGSYDGKKKVDSPAPVPAVTGGPAPISTKLTPPSVSNPMIAPVSEKMPVKSALKTSLRTPSLVQPSAQNIVLKSASQPEVNKPAPMKSNIALAESLLSAIKQNLHRKQPEDPPEVKLQKSLNKFCDILPPEVLAMLNSPHVLQKPAVFDMLSSLDTFAQSLSVTYTPLRKQTELKKYFVHLLTAIDI